MPTHTKQQRDAQYEEILSALKNALVRADARDILRACLPLQAGTTVGANQKAAYDATFGRVTRAYTSRLTLLGAIKQYNRKHDRKRDSGKNIKGVVAHGVDVIYSFVFITTTNKIVTAAPMIRYAIKS